MNTSFKGLVAVTSVACMLGFCYSAYSILNYTHSQSQRTYTIANTKPDGGPRVLTLGSSSGSSRLTNVDNTQTN